MNVYLKVPGTLFQCHILGIASFLLCSANYVMGDVLALNGNQKQPSFDRLFSTKLDRDYVDKSIRSGPEISQEDVVGTLEEGDVSVDIPFMQNIKFSGYILRPDGKYQVWIDGKSELSEGFTSKEYIRSKPNKNNGRLLLDYHGRRKSIKPGQVWVVSSDDVKESYAVAHEEPVIKSVMAIPEISDLDEIADPVVREAASGVDPNLTIDTISTQDIKKILKDITELQKKLDHLSVGG